jgi:RNA polymerase sigma factor (sigma-70 family)
MPDDDLALVLRCRAGDAEAWLVLVQRYERLVYSIARSFGLVAHDAADVLQATFEALLQSIDRLEHAERLSAWLTTVAKRQSIRLRQRNDRVVESGGDAADEPGFNRVDELDALLRALDVLPVDCRRLVQELYMSSSQPTYADLSIRLGIPVGSIGPTRARCLDRLRRLMDGDGALS